MRGEGTRTGVGLDVRLEGLHEGVHAVGVPSDVADLEQEDVAERHGLGSVDVPVHDQRAALSCRSRERGDAHGGCLSEVKCTAKEHELPRAQGVLVRGQVPREHAHGGVNRAVFSGVVDELIHAALVEPNAAFSVEERLGDREGHALAQHATGGEGTELCIGGEVDDRHRIVLSGVAGEFHAGHTSARVSRGDGVWRGARVLQRVGHRDAAVGRGGLRGHVIPNGEVHVFRGGSAVVVGHGHLHAGSGHVLGQDLEGALCTDSTHATAHAEVVVHATDFDGPGVGQAVAGHTVHVEGEHVKLERCFLGHDEIAGVEHRHREDAGLVVHHIEVHDLPVVGGLLVRDRGVETLSGGVPHAEEVQVSLEVVLSDGQRVLVVEHHTSGTEDVSFLRRTLAVVGAKELVGVGWSKAGGALVCVVGVFRTVRRGHGEHHVPVDHLADVGTEVTDGGVEEGGAHAQVEVHAVLNHRGRFTGAVGAVTLGHGEGLEADVMEEGAEAVDVIGVRARVIVVGLEVLAPVVAGQFNRWLGRGVIDPRFGASRVLTVHRVVNDTGVDAVASIAWGDRTGHGPSGLEGQNRARGVGTGVGGGVAVDFNGLCVAGNDEPFLTVDTEVKTTAACGVKSVELNAHVDLARVEILAAICGDGQQELAGLGARSNRTVAFFADAGAVGPAQVDLDVRVVTHDDVDFLFIVRRVGVLVRVDGNHNEVLTDAGGPRDVRAAAGQGGCATCVDGVGREGRLVAGRGFIAHRHIVGPRQGLAGGVQGLEASGLGGIGQVDVQRVRHVLHITGTDVLHDHFKGGRFTDEQLVTAACRRTRGLGRLGDAEDVDVCARSSAGLVDGVFGVKFVGWNSREQASEQQRHEKHGGHVSHLGPSTMWLGMPTLCAVYIIWDEAKFGVNGLLRGNYHHSSERSASAGAIFVALRIGTNTAALTSTMPPSRTDRALPHGSDSSAPCSAHRAACKRT